MKIAIGSDHAGFERKSEIVSFLKDKGYEVIDKGTFSEDRADYPDFAHLVAESVLSKEVETGILLCGSGNGIAMSANKHAGIRAALCWNEEITALARQHNNANILVLPARYITNKLATTCAEIFLNTAFEGGRHQNRIEKIDL